jgi:hypothetical protein
MSDPKKDELDDIKRIMGALVRMPPKPHDQMKLGKPRGKSSKSPAKRRSAKPPKE